MLHVDAIFNEPFVMRRHKSFAAVRMKVLKSHRQF
jgi:hypothetical protein